MGSLRDDLRYAFRRLRQQPALAAIALTALSVGLGANTAIFTLIYAAMMRPLPVDRPGELVRVGRTFNCCVNSGVQDDYSLYSTGLAAHLRESLADDVDLTAFQANTSTWAIRAEGAAVARALPAQFVQGNYFEVLGVRAALGRALQPQDDDSAAGPVVVLGDRAWREAFDADPNVIGRHAVVGGMPVTVVGVMPASFFGETVRANPAAFWLPLGQEPAMRPGASVSRQDRNDWLYAMGRRRSNVTLEALSAKANAALHRWLSAQTFWSEEDRRQIAQASVTVVDASGGVQPMRTNFGRQLNVLLMMSALVLFIVAANLANLLLARADRVTAAIRSALGASASRLVRQSLAEALLLAIGGALGALLVSRFAATAIVALAFPADAVLPMSLSPSPAIVLGSLGVAVATAFVFGAAPAWLMSKTNPIDALRGLAREGASVSFVPKRSLVVMQVTLSMVLLSGAGLLSLSLRRLESQPLGFEPDHRLVARVTVPNLAAEPARLEQLYERMQAALRAIPGVVRSSYSLYSPMENNNWSGRVSVAGHTPATPRGDTSAWNRVGPDYFATIGTTLVRGRTLSPTDRPGAPRVAVVNEAFAKAFFPAGDAIGGHFGVGGPERAHDYEIVGIVSDVKYIAPADPVRPMAFMPMLQTVPLDSPDAARSQARSTLAGTVEIQVAAGTGSIEAAVRRALASAHADLVVTRFLTLEAQVSGNFRNNRLLATLAAAYGVLALLLATLGLYGVTAHGVAQRTHEIGVRMALGADRSRIVRGVLAGAFWQSALGVVIGGPLAIAASATVSAQLYAVRATNPAILGAAAIILMAAALGAAALPARRAASVDPTQALRR